VILVTCPTIWAAGFGTEFGTASLKPGSLPLLDGQIVAARPMDATVDLRDHTVIGLSRVIIGRSIHLGGSGKSQQLPTPLGTDWSAKKTARVVAARAVQTSAKRMMNSGFSPARPHDLHQADAQQTR
jgi:hypothetical protein